MSIKNLNKNKDIIQLDTSVKLEYDKRMETGRTLMEMLGTLAIVGVLSIGGIMGYRYAMDKYEANVVVNEVMLRSADFAAQKVRGGKIIDTWPQKIGDDYDIILWDDEDGEGIGIWGYNMNKSTCQMIFDKMIGKSVVKIFTEDGPQIYDTPTSDAGCREVSTIMVFYTDEIIELSSEDEEIAEEQPEEVTCGSDAYTQAECDDENDFYVGASDQCAVKKYNESCPNRELDGDYSRKKCNLTDFHTNGGSCPVVEHPDIGTEDDVVAVNCEWSDWINNDHPSADEDGGDRESYEAACPKEYATEVECRAAVEPDIDIALLGQKLTCDLENGLVCNNIDQWGNGPFGVCYDYELRVYCCEPVP